MSCTIETIIACDICAENNGGDDRTYTAKVIRERRGEAGWRYVKGKDYCPKCWAATARAIRAARAQGGSK